MAEPRTARIRLGEPGLATIEIDGQDVSDAIRGFTLKGEVDHRHRLTLDLLIDTGEANGEVQAHIPDATAAVLQSLGWTPPDGWPAPTPRLVKVDGILTNSDADTAREALRQTDADPHGRDAGMIVKPYQEHGQTKWVFRCWGTDDGCDGWLGLGHYTEASAQRERDRHVAEEHGEQATT